MARFCENLVKTDGTCEIVLFFCGLETYLRFFQKKHKMFSNLHAKKHGLTV